MPRLTRLHSFLDRFSEQLELDCEQLKYQLVAQVDQQFGLLRTKVFELRVRFGGERGNRDAIPSVYLDDPQIESVSLDDWVVQRRESLNVPSTSSGVKRKSTASQTQSSNKRRKSAGSTSLRNKFVCKYAGCGKAFAFDANLAKHERIHLGVKPFSCIWDNCSFRAEQRETVITHIRMKHFKLPRSLKEQQSLNIVDNRNPNDFIQVDADLLTRRLQ